VTDEWKELVTEVIDSLSKDEREESIAYLEERLIPTGEELPWEGLRRSFDKEVVVAFVDLEPALNWTHRGRYIVLGAKGGIEAIVEVDRPPFLTGVSPYLRLIHRGNRAPSWAVITAATDS
jgi:hypothetical protein